MDGQVKNTKNIWHMTQIFTTPITFSIDQSFSISGLFHPSQNIGDLLFYNNTWDNLTIGNNGEVLSVVGNIPRWSKLDLSHSVLGNLSVKNGGTGLSSFLAGDLLYAIHSEQLSAVPIGQEDQVLTVIDDTPTWSFPDRGVVGNGEISRLAVWLSPDEISSSNISIYDTVLKIDNCLSLNDNFIIQSDHSSSINISSVSGKLSLKMNSDNDSIFSLSLEKKVIFSLNGVGHILIGSIPTTNLLGNIQVNQGGTGIDVYSRGDLIYAESKNTLARITTRGNEGKFLSVVDNVPKWVDISDISINSNIYKDIIQIDGYDSYVIFPDGTKSKLQYSKNVDEVGILTLDQGGTGTDLSVNATIGDILCFSGEGLLGLISSSTRGMFLQSNGTGNIPSWGKAIVSIDGSSGINVDSEDIPLITIDQSANFNPNWAGLHTFINGINSTYINISNTSNGVDGKLWFDGKDLLFSSNDTNVNITSGNRYIENKVSPQSHYIPICVRLTPITNTYDKVKIPLPYSVKNGIDNIKWRLKRIDFRCDVPPINGTASFNIRVKNDWILEPDIFVSSGEDTTSKTQFISSYLNSGDLLQVYFKNVSESDMWSIWILIEEIN